MISIDEAISASQRRAKRLWLISILWILVMLVIAIIFGASIYQFNETRSELEKLKSTADGLIADLEKTKQELSVLENKYRAQSRINYAFSLMMRGPSNLTAEQQKFIKRQADEASSEQPSPETLYLQAAAESIDGKYQQSYDTYTEALSLAPELGEAYSGRGYVGLALGEYAKAYDDFTQALKLDKDVTHRPILLARRAGALVGLGRVEEAEQEVAEASRSDDPTDRGAALFYHGMIKLKRRDWEVAETDFRAAAALSLPNRGLRLENIGLIYLAQSDWARAYNWSVAISKMSDTFEWMWMIEALAAEKLGKTEERRAAVQRFIKSNHDPTLSLKTLSFYLTDDLALLARSWVLHAQK
jgi:tetratricopeptide (TPR) repeat protein